MNELTESFEGLDFKYKFKEKKYDCKYMIVVFSGFGARNDFTYNMQRALKDIFASVLWIKDDFHDNSCYYHSVNKENISEIINNFILKKAKERGFEKEDIILSGFSKGGSAAIYYGLKYNYRYIISTVPQFKMATYCKESHPNVLLHMLGSDYSISEFNNLDNALVEVIDLDKNLDKNIFLLTSKADEQYELQVKPFIYNLCKYTNLNVFFSDSVFVNTHNQVTAHHLQLILAWYYSIINDSIPSYGFKSIKGNQKVYAKDDIIDYEDNIFELKACRIAEKIIFPEGVGIVRGIPLQKWSDIDYYLIFSNNAEFEKEYKIAKDQNSALTKELYKDKFCFYDKGWFCTVKHNGLNVSDLPKGKFYIKLKAIFNINNITVIKNLKTNMDLENIKSDSLRLSSDEERNLMLEVL